MQEDDNIMQEDDNNNFRVVYDSILKFIKVLVYGSLGALVVGAAFFWFFYEVEGEPLSAHTSEVGLKLAKQLTTDGYLAGAKVIFTEKKYCIQHADMGENIHHPRGHCQQMHPVARELFDCRGLEIHHAHDVDRG